MRELLQQYFNIAFLMGKPQDLPSGSDQMKVGVLLALVTYVMATTIAYGPVRALLHAVLDLGVSALVLHFALSILGRKNRFEQAFGGLCGASAFINLSAVPLYALYVPGSDGSGSTMATLPSFVLLVWGLSLTGHVIRHTFEVSIQASILISFLYLVFLMTLFSILLPTPMSAPTGEVSMFGNVIDAVALGRSGWVSA